MYNNRMKNIEIPENLFSNLGEMQTKRIMDNKEIIPVKPELSTEEERQLPTNPKRSEYRERITKMYEDIKNLKPIDNSIDNVLYFNNYVEKGIVIKPKISSLKQFWTEYRLINNEKKVPFEKRKEPITQKIDSFDNLFEALLVKVDEINKYIDELKTMKNEIDATTTKLQKDKEQLKADRKEFLEYKENEENKIKEEKENLKINFAKLQTIIDDLDKKLGSVDE